MASTPDSKTVGSAKSANANNVLPQSNHERMMALLVRHRVGKKLREKIQLKQVSTCSG